MVKARMRCTGNFPSHDGPSAPRIVVLSAVYSSEPDDPNRSFAEATPSADLRMWITNRAAFEQFEVNKVYDLTFLPVD